MIFIIAITVEEVVNKSYTQANLPRDINERFACVTSLLLASESEVKECRKFIRKYCDPEYLQLYDICWIGNDENRMEKIIELKEISTNNNMSMLNKGVGKVK